MPDSLFAPLDNVTHSHIAAFHVVERVKDRLHVTGYDIGCSDRIGHFVIIQENQLLDCLNLGFLVAVDAAQHHSDIGGQVVSGAQDRESSHWKTLFRLLSLIHI